MLLWNVERSLTARRFLGVSMSGKGPSAHCLVIFGCVWPILGVCLMLQKKKKRIAGINEGNASNGIYQIERKES